MDKDIENIDMWVERVNKKFFEKMKVYSKAVIDWLLGQQQYCLTLKYICALDQSAA